MYVTQVEGGMRRLKRVDVAEHAFISSQVLALAEKMGDRNCEVFRMLALGQVLAATVNQPFDGMDDKLSRLRKRIIEDIKENLEALQECQRRRAIEVQSSSTEAYTEEVDGPRRLRASMRLPACPTAQVSSASGRQTDVN